nr:FecR domain-containing protein [Pseudomonas sp. TH32]
MADYHTATGERRHHTLSDGTQIWLNTRTLLDAQYDAQERRLTLRQGEVDILTASDPARRPLLVYTAEARLQPLGTRFTVRREDDGRGTRVAVSSGRVAASLKAGGEALVVDAHSQAWISSTRVYPAQPASLNETAWIDGFIVAERMRLADFAQELTRYLPGILRCEPAVADLRLSGSYPLNNPGQIFAMLEQSLPVKVQQRTRYWVTLTTR